ncbi:hypothetical protein SEVIR_5G424801v4 [Setaria viridis]
MTAIPVAASTSGSISYESICNTETEDPTLEAGVGDGVVKPFTAAEGEAFAVASASSSEAAAFTFSLATASASSAFFFAIAHASAASNSLVAAASTSSAAANALSNASSVVPVAADDRRRRERIELDREMDRNGGGKIPLAFNCFYL